MKLRIFVVVLSVLLFAVPTWAEGQQPMPTQKVVMTVARLQTMAIHDGEEPVILDISTAVPGEVPSVSAEAGTYAITSNAPMAHLYGHLQSDLPKGVVLKVLLEAPPGATSLGWVTLSSNPQMLVTGITPVATNNMKIHYELTAEPEVDAPLYKMVNVAFTLTDS